jgi:hypothetical protein
MPRLHEVFGYRIADTTAPSVTAAAAGYCPITFSQCTKPGRGVCAVAPASGLPVIICPDRLKFGGYRILREIALLAFARFGVPLAPNGLPGIVPGSEGRSTALASGTMTVGVFGKGFGQASGEVQLPPVPPSTSGYSVDYVMVLLDPTGDLVSFAVVELQTIDTTNNYTTSVQAFVNGRQDVPSSFGLNWENVNKRILPQLITKGLMLQGERLCHTGIYLVAPQPVFDRIMLRLGGQERFRRLPAHPGSITFLNYIYEDLAAPYGSPLRLIHQAPWTISTSDLSLAFITPENLPPAGSYERRLLDRI